MGSWMGATWRLMVRGSLRLAHGPHEQPLSPILGATQGDTWRAVGGITKQPTHPSTARPGLLACATPAAGGDGVAAVVDHKRDQAAKQKHQRHNQRHLPQGGDKGRE